MDPELKASYRFCAEISRREAKNFYYSFLLLPPERRRSMCALYAFLRHTDDLADEPGPVEDKRVALDRWRIDLDASLGSLSGGSPHRVPLVVPDQCSPGQTAPQHWSSTTSGTREDWPGFPALAHTVEKHGIPPRHLHEVLDGVGMDLEPRVFAKFEDLYTYCYRVASAVGLSCIHIWGFQSQGGRAEALAEQCGVALQLTNILRDVREDARLGRIYLPQEDMNNFGVSPEDLKANELGPRVRELFEFQGRRAYDFYAKAAPLTCMVAPVGRPVLRAIVGIYRALLDEIARRDWNVLSGRVALPSWKKAAITLGALAGVGR